MELERAGLSDQELTDLARVCGRDLDDLTEELRRRPWAIHDILGEPETIAAVFESDGLIDTVSPFVLFAVMARQAADDLLDREYINDWVGPRARLPVFDVEPLREFSMAPGRLLFVARLLTSMVVPACSSIPVPTTDPWELVDWLNAVDDSARVTVLRRLGDMSLFLAGVHADAIGDDVLDGTRVDQIARSVNLAPAEVVELLDPESAGSGLELLERIGACWYTESRRIEPATPPIVLDIAQRIGAARRFLTHMADGYLSDSEVQFPFAA